MLIDVRWLRATLLGWNDPLMLRRNKVGDYKNVLSSSNPIWHQILFGADAST
jgi:hypothetical protein